MNTYTENIKTFAAGKGLELTHEQAELTSKVLLLMQEAYGTGGKVIEVKQDGLILDAAFYMYADKEDIDQLYSLCKKMKADVVERMKEEKAV